MMIILLYINFVPSFFCEISVALYSLFNIVIKLEASFEICQRRNSVVHFGRVVRIFQLIQMSHITLCILRVQDLCLVISLVSFSICMVHKYELRL